MGGVVFIIGVVVTAAGTVHVFFFMAVIAIGSMHVVMIMPMIAVRAVHMVMMFMAMRGAEHKLSAAGAGRKCGGAFEHGFHAFDIIGHGFICGMARGEKQPFSL